MGNYVKNHNMVVKNEKAMNSSFTVKMPNSAY